MKTKIVIIQNTNYHFETCISLYQILNNLSYNTFIYRFLPDIYEQNQFLLDSNVQLADKDMLKQASVGIFVSAYPNPSVPKEQSIPNFDIIQNLNLKIKFLYISHRFKNDQDYEDHPMGINRNNTICLSPLASKINLDYIHLLDTVLLPNNLLLDNTLNLTIQGHFELKNRNWEHLTHMLKTLMDYPLCGNKKIIINFIGTGVDRIRINSNSFLNLTVNKYNNLCEKQFYDIINNDTHFFVPLIDPYIKNQTYSNERYSSTFNHSLALEKPLLAHEFFQDIYHIPGYYYNNNNIPNILKNLCNITNDEYQNLIKALKNLKKQFILHNIKILENKINYVSNI